MGGVAEVRGIERTIDGLETKCDPGGGAILTAAHYAPPGVDAVPMMGDSVALEESTGAGNVQATAYYDPKNPSKASEGEHRVYARNALGIAVCEVWLKGDGSIHVTPMNGARVTVAGGAEFVALAEKVLTELNSIKTAFDTHTHLYNPGPSAPAPTAPPAVPMTPPGSVASEVLQSD